MRLTQKLLNTLHRVFDKQPAEFLALRLQYDGGMVWTVAEATLSTVVDGGSGVNLTVDLTQYTVGQLINFLASQPGYSIPFGDTDENSVLSSRLLLDGTNDISLSNGDHLYGYTNVLFSFLEANALELENAQAQIPNAIAQLSTTTAQAYWLDRLGNFYGVPRLAGEADTSYSPRIPAEVLRPRGNNVALENAIKAYTGQDALVTDVTLYGSTFPLYDGEITRNSIWDYAATAQPLYGLFDVEYGYDLLNGGDITAFAAIVTGIIDRLRDAGTHMRSLLLKGSDISDTFTPPTDGASDTSDLGIDVDGEFTDTLTSPTDALDPVDVGVGAMTDTLDAPLDGLGIMVLYNYRYNSVRHRDSKIYYLGNTATAENVGSVGDIPFDQLLRADGSVIADGSQISDGLR
jgi:hypothetical protein